MKILIQKECEIEETPRTQLLGAMFEVPAKQKLSVTLTGELPENFLQQTWSLGLIVGPSGSGKTLLLNELFGRPIDLTWSSKSVIDDFSKELSMEVISRVCQSVGFNTIPSWLRPFSVLSNGEKFRVETARRMAESGDILCIDEFTSVVDRVVAQFASHSIQKYVRTTDKKLIAASCHYDIIPWLQPDWILEPGNPCRLTWRSLRQRPPITVSVSRVKYETWNLFKDFHYMSAELNHAARCYGLFIHPTTDGSLADVLELGYQPDVLHPEIERPSSINEFSNAEWLGSPRPNPSRTGGVGLGGSSPFDGGAGGYKSATTESSFNQSTTGDGSSQTATTDVGESVSATMADSCEPLSERGINTKNDEPRITSMCGVLYRPHPRVRDIVGFTRMVTLPDYQGLGLAFVLANQVASAYKALGKRLHSYPNHPAWIRSYQRSKDWLQVKNSGIFSPSRGSSSTVAGFGGKRCAVFMFVGNPMNVEEAERLINGN